MKLVSIVKTLDIKMKYVQNRLQFVANRGEYYLSQNLPVTFFIIISVLKHLFTLYLWQFAVVITDGNQTKTGRYTRLSIAVQGLKNKGVAVYAFGVGRAADMAELLEIASAPEYVFRSQSFKRLQNLTSGLRGEFCVGNDLQMFDANIVLVT